jgi:hypothetical protein
MCEGKTRKYLLRVLVAMLYLQRTGDARTYWLLLPKRMKFGRTAIYFCLRAQSAAAIDAMFAKYNHFHGMMAAIRAGNTFDLTAAVFQIPFKAHKQFYVTTDE